MKTVIVLLFSAMAVFQGCDGRIYRSDLTPPGAPRGLYTITGDNVVDLCWIHNGEDDVAGYNVFVSSSYNGRYQFIGSTNLNHFIDQDARNGNTYYYAVSAYDFAGNESELSRDIAYDTPRPEGYGVVLYDYRANPSLAGYDFSTYSIGQYNDQYTDIFFEYFSGGYYMNVWQDSDIQDMGFTTSLLEIGEAPASGWSPTKDARLIAGHTYVAWTWDNHYAKFRVKSLSPSRVVFDWAFQLQSGNPRLKPAGSGREGELRMGRGALQRVNVTQ